MPKATDAHTPVLRFTAGQFTPLPPDHLPECFKPALDADNGDLDFALSGAGCTLTEQYGTDAALDVWMAPAGYLVVWYTGASTVLIYAESMVDIMELESRFIAPTAVKLMAEHNHFHAMRELRRQVA